MEEGPTLRCQEHCEVRPNASLNRTLRAANGNEQSVGSARGEVLAIIANKRIQE